MDKRRRRRRRRIRRRRRESYHESSEIRRPPPSRDLPRFLRLSLSLSLENDRDAQRRTRFAAEIRLQHFSSLPPRVRIPGGIPREQPRSPSDEGDNEHHESALGNEISRALTFKRLSEEEEEEKHAPGGIPFQLAILFSGTTLLGTSCRGFLGVSFPESISPRGPLARSSRSQWRRRPATGSLSLSRM